jgi:hypothetical protein
MRTISRTSILIALAGSVLLPVGAARGQDLSSLTRVEDARSRRVSSSAKEDWSNGDNRHVPPGQTFTVADIEGAGVIRHVWLTFPESAPSWISKAGSASPDEVVLRMYWDGSAEPAVEAPLGDFFAVGFGQRAEVRSTPVQVQGLDAYNCFWAMPYRSRARITVTNESDRPFTAFYFQVDYTEEKVPEDAAYFCAQYRQEFPCVGGRDYLLADIEAPRGGHYVGTVLSVRQRSPQWFGEGDDRFFVDGEARPSIRGTGTEDYFLCAWGFEKCTFPEFGVPWMSGDGMGQVGDQASMYRWHLSDPIRFGKSLRATLEHTGWMDADETTTGKVEGHVERGDDYASVAFWYQRGQPKRFASIPPLKDRRLPAIDTVIDGKALLATAKATGGDGMRLQAGGAWTGEGQILFDGAKAGDALACTFEQPGGKPLHLVVRLTHSYDFGVYALKLDGKVIAEGLDLYSPTIEVKEHHMGELPAGAGSHVLTLECVGVNPSSKGAKLGLDSVKLRERAGVKRAPLGPKPGR